MINTITTIMMIIIMISVASGRRIVETRLGNYPLVPLPPAATKSHLQSCHPCGCRHHHRSLSIRCRKKQTRMILMMIMRIISMMTIIMTMMKSKTMTILTWAGNEQIWCLRVHRHVKIPTLYTDLHTGIGAIYVQHKHAGTWIRLVIIQYAATLYKSCRWQYTEVQ